MLVAINTTEHREVARRRMTIDTVVPFSVVGTTVDREVHIIVIKGSRRPSRLAVAGFAGSREARTDVVGVVGRIIVLTVAAKTSIWRIAVVATYMASYAVVRNGGMCPN